MQQNMIKIVRNCIAALFFVSKKIQGASVSHVSPKAHSEPATSPDMLT